MKKLLLLTLAIGMMACSNDEQTNEVKYERQIVNGERTSNTRQTNSNTVCVEITETGTYQDTTYYWVVVCE
jgi:hypothetical protein